MAQEHDVRVRTWSTRILAQVRGGTRMMNETVIKVVPPYVYTIHSRSNRMHASLGVLLHACIRGPHTTTPSSRSMMHMAVLLSRFFELTLPYPTGWIRSASCPENSSRCTVHVHVHAYTAVYTATFFPFVRTSFRFTFTDHYINWITPHVRTCANDAKKHRPPRLAGL